MLQDKSKRKNSENVTPFEKRGRLSGCLVDSFKLGCILLSLVTISLSMAVYRIISDPEPTPVRSIYNPNNGEWTQEFERYVINSCRYITCNPAELSNDQASVLDICFRDVFFDGEYNISDDLRVTGFSADVGTSVIECFERNGFYPYGQ